MEEHGYNDISENWKGILKCEDVFEKLSTPNKNTFRCFKYCEPKDIKIIIIGQDPYIDGDGLAFSSSSYKVAICTILNCLKRKGLLKYEKNYAQLQPWAERGALLMNAMLTTGKKKNTDKISHTFWLPYTKNVVDYFKDKNVIFFVWGKFAEGIMGEIDITKKFVHVHPCAKAGVWDFDGFDNVTFDWSL